ncbi:hypothetical protein HAX54_028833, partial [Datura stramonium]|nr:hypothetical protein [Datura stramonium]
SNYTGSVLVDFAGKEKRRSAAEIFSGDRWLEKWSGGAVRRRCGGWLVSRWLIGGKERRWRGWRGREGCRRGEMGEGEGGPAAVWCYLAGNTKTTGKRGG